METQLVIAIVAGSSALLGSAVGGLVTYFSTRSIRRMEWKIERIDIAAQQRERLYLDFLSETARLMNLAVGENKVSSAEELSKMIELSLHIGFVSDTVGNKASKLASYVLDHHGESDEPQDTTMTFSALKNEFVETCRHDIKQLRESA